MTPLFAAATSILPLGEKQHFRSDCGDESAPCPFAAARPAATGRRTGRCAPPSHFLVDPVVFWQSRCPKPASPGSARQSLRPRRPTRPPPQSALPAFSTWPRPWLGERPAPAWPQPEILIRRRLVPARTVPPYATPPRPIPPGPSLVRTMLSPMLRRTASARDESNADAAIPVLAPSVRRRCRRANPIAALPPRSSVPPNSTTPTVPDTSPANTPAPHRALSADRDFRPMRRDRYHSASRLAFRADGGEAGRPVISGRCARPRSEANWPTMAPLATKRTCGEERERRPGRHP